MKLFNTARIFSFLFFFIPYITLYAQELGFSLSQIMLVESFFALLIVFLDIPLAHFSDKFGAKKILILGSFLQSLACFLLFFWQKPQVFWFAQIIFAFAVSLARGADATLHYKILQKNGHQEAFKRRESLFLTRLMVFEFIAFIMAGYLATWGSHYTFLATGGTQLLSTFLFLALPHFENLEKKSPAPHFSLRERLSLLSTILRENTSLKKNLIPIFFIGGALITVTHLIPLIALDKGLKSQDIGYLFGFAGVVAFFFNRLFLLQKKSEVFALFLGALGFGGLFLSSYAALFIALTLIKYSGVILIPFFKESILKQLQETGENTALSVVSTLFNLGFALTGPLFGFYGDTLGINAMLFLVVILFLIGAIVIFQNLKGIKR